MSLTALRVQTRPESVTTSRPAWWWACLQLTSLAFFIPLSRLSGPQRALTDSVTAMWVGGAVTLGGLLVYLIVSRVSGSPWKALAWSSTVLVFFWQWGAWSSAGAGVSWLVSLALLVVVLVAVGRFAERPLFRKSLLVTSVTLAITALVLIISDAAGTAPSSLESQGSPELGVPARTPDVILLVLDSYAREDVLLEEFGFDNGAFLSTLRNSGFEIPDSANANYTMTHLSIPSLLSMDYLDSSTGELGHADLRRLEAMASGANPVVDALKSTGYRYIHGSADNWLNHCSDAADVCLPGPAIDQTAFALLSETPAGPLLYPTSGDPTTALNRQRIEQLRAWGGWRDSLGDAPIFTYLHLGLPHPPLFLDSQCEPRAHHNLSGQLINFLSMSPEIVELRKQAYVDQVKCANSTVTAFLDQLEGDEIVIITADHGPDSNGLLNADPATWTDGQLHERLATFAAMKLPAACDSGIDPNLQLVNVFRVVFNCIYPSADLPMLQPEYGAASFGGPIIHLDDPDGSDV